MEWKTTMMITLNNLIPLLNDAINASKNHQPSEKQENMPQMRIKSISWRVPTVISSSRTKSLSKFIILFIFLHIKTIKSPPNRLFLTKFLNEVKTDGRVAAAEHISLVMLLLHIEVNTIRELPQNSKIVAIHTDSPDVLIWDVDAQPNCHAVLEADESRPDLILTGHQDYAE